MLGGIGKAGAAGAAAAEKFEVLNTPLTNGTSGDAGYLSTQKDAKESARAAQYGEVYKQLQAKYGEKPEKQREIKKTLGKDDFLRIMLTQMKNQDPTNPFKAEQMATEIAQFTSVEQLQNVNQNLNKMANQNKPMENLAMTQLIGKTVTIDRTRFVHTEGQNEQLSFHLPQDAQSVRVAIISETGETVLEKDIGSKKSGEIQFDWDGKKTNTLAAKGGNYMLRVDAKGERGQALETTPTSQTQVIGVSFEGAEPVFIVGDAKHQEKITMRNIQRIDQENKDIRKEVSHPPLQAILPPDPVHLNPEELRPQAVNRESPASTPTIQQQQGAAPVQSEEKGFPNGLKDNEP